MITWSSSWTGSKGQKTVAEHLAARLAVSVWSPEQLWTALETFAKKVAGRAQSEWDWRQDFRLTEALALHPEFAAQRSMQQLAGTERSWMDVFAADLLGMLRHRPAMDLLLGMLEDSLSSDCSSATRSLAWIGGEDIHQRLLTEFANRKGQHRRHLLDVIAAQQTPQAEQSLIDLIQSDQLDEQEEELSTATGCLVNLFTTNGIDLLRQIVREGRYNPGYSDLREDVVILGKATGIVIPEAAEWEKAVAADVAERKTMSSVQWLASCLGPLRPSADESGVVESSLAEQTPSDSPKVGRNEPCPCGSGKKYKKCCIGRE